MLRSKKLADKIMVLGVDGMDPRLTRRYIDEGHLPNLKKLAEMGAQRHDFVMLGAQPTVTPPQWTTLAVGANPCVHGITQFGRTVPGKINQNGYNVDSRLVKAEQVWNCTAEGGYKTLVFHWPGGAWPPSSDSENLFVIDGSAPGSVGSAAMQRDTELLVGASVDIPEAKFITRMVDDAVAPCVITKLPDQPLEALDTAKGMQMTQSLDEEMTSKLQNMGMDTVNIVAGPESGFGTRAGSFPQPVNTAVSPIKDASGWAAAPEGAKEFSIYLCKGLIRRLGLILKNEQGVYDTLYISSAMDTQCDTVIHPKRLAKALVENAGPFPPQSQMYTQDLNMQSCMLEVWDGVTDWYIKTLEYMIENEDIEVIFSHLHSVDFVEHTFIRYMGEKKGGIGYSQHDPEVYDGLMRNLYKQVDRYVGSMMHYLDEGWTIMITADHAQVAPKYKPPGIGDMCGVNADLMEELGYTVLKTNDKGKKVIDWSKTRAIASQGNDIFINLKGREPQGIVDPADKYELEEQIITDLYNYKHPDSHKRVIAMALHNKDAILLGYGGPTAGDICFWVAEGYNYDHCDSLSTAYGDQGTSSSPIFIAAGKGLKKGFETDRIIRQVDLAPTVCVMLGCRIPAQCEGAPIYQILEEEL